MIEIRQLEYFMAVCKELHFTRAAEKLNIAQPTLSQQIKSLEGQVGVPLFDRIGKKIALTEAGEILYRHSKRIFYEIEQAEAALRDLHGLQRGKLTIGSLLTCVNYLFPPSILKFKQLYPDIHLTVLGLRAAEIIEGLLENELDLGLSFLPIMNDDLKTIPLFDEELALAVSYNHPFASLNEIDLRSLENEEIILLPKQYYLRQLLEKYFSELKMIIRPTLEMTTLESLVQMVAEDVGMTILPAPYLDFLQHEKIVQVKLVDPTPLRKIGFIYRTNKYMCTATRKFIDQVMNTSMTVK